VVNAPWYQGRSLPRSRGCAEICVTMVPWKAGTTVRPSPCPQGINGPRSMGYQSSRWTNVVDEIVLASSRQEIADANALAATFATHLESMVARTLLNLARWYNKSLWFPAPRESRRSRGRDSNFTGLSWSPAIKASYKAMNPGRLAHWFIETLVPVIPGSKEPINRGIKGRGWQGCN
jgi:hypothetical protein